MIFPVRQRIKTTGIYKLLTRFSYLQVPNKRKKKRLRGGSMDDAPELTHEEEKKFFEQLQIQFDRSRKDQDDKKSAESSQSSSIDVMDGPEINIINPSRRASQDENGF
jgi:hypothetical protein